MLGLGFPPPGIGRDLGAGNGDARKRFST